MRRAAWLGMVLLVAAAGRAQPADPAPGMVRAVVAAEVTAADGGAPGAAVVVRAGGVTRFFNFGLADVRGQKPVTPDSIFELASVTKVFTTTLLALAVQDHEVELTDPVAKYLPALADGGDIRQVTLGELATHTSGLPRVPPRRGRPYTQADLLDYLRGWHRTVPPGRHFLYSNLGVGLLQCCPTLKEEGCAKWMVSSDSSNRSGAHDLNAKPGFSGLTGHEHWPDRLYPGDRPHSALGVSACLQRL